MHRLHLVQGPGVWPLGIGIVLLFLVILTYSTVWDWRFWPSFLLVQNQTFLWSKSDFRRVGQRVAGHPRRGVRRLTFWMRIPTPTQGSENSSNNISDNSRGGREVEPFFPCLCSSLV